MASCSGFESVVRPQQTFSVDDKTLAALFTLNVAPQSPTPVNIAAQLTVKPCNSKINLVKVCVGPGDISTGPGYAAQVIQQQQFLANLKRLGIKFTTQTVIQINNPQPVLGTPGQYRKVLSALACADINVLATYSGEPGTLNPTIPSSIVEVPQCDIRRAQDILCNLDIIDFDNPANGYCITTANWQAVCVRNGNACKSDC